MAAVSSVKRRSVSSACLFLLAIIACCHGRLDLYITRSHLQSNLDLDLGKDVYLIENGKTSALLTNPTAFKYFMAPLPANLKEIEFTWRSHPSHIEYEFQMFSSNTKILSVPHLSIPAAGVVPLYNKVFALYVECDGDKFGTVEVEMRLNYTTTTQTGFEQELFRIRARKECPKRALSDTGSTTVVASSSWGLGAKIAVASTVTFVCCLSVLGMAYCCYRKRTEKKHIIFDSDYELAAKRRTKPKKVYTPDIPDDLFIEELDTPPRPIFARKARPVKKWYRTRRHRRGLTLPLEGTPPPAYTASPTSPLSPGSSLGLLSKIPEELEERLDDEFITDERQPILMSEQRKISRGSRHSVTDSCTVAIDEMNESQDKEGDKQSLFDVLNQHWQHQFSDSLLSVDQVVVDKNALGKGTFGCVYCGTVTSATATTGTVPVAVKTMQESTDFDVITRFVNEAAMMKSMRHPHVMPLIGIVLQATAPPMLVMPYMKFGDLNQFLRNARPTPRKPQTLSTRQLINFGSKIAQGLNYISSLGIVHRDLSTRNCMVNEEYDVMIGDFGLAIDMASADQCRSVAREQLPIKWSAIESIRNGSFSEASDVWSFGICLWELMSLGKQPYSSVRIEDMESHLLHGNRLLQTHNCPNEIYEIMLSCWKHDPEERPTFAELCLKLSAYEARYRQYSIDSRVPSGSSSPV